MFASRSLALLAALALMPLTVQAQIYKYYDQNGNLVLTDAPREGAVKIETSPVMTVPALRGTAPATPAGATPPKPAAVPNYMVLLNSPPPDTAYRRGGDPVPIGVTVAPSLQDGHRLEVLFNGQPIPSGTSELVLDESIDRGAHTLQARVVDATGKVLATSTAVTITVLQGSQLAPKPAPPPKPKSK